MLRRCVQGEGRIIKLAANLIAQNIEGIESDPDTYFSVDDIGIEEQLSMTPSSLKHLISRLIPKRSAAEKSTDTAAVCQVLVTLQSSYKVMLWEFRCIV